MGLDSIKIALESAAKTALGVFPTAWENTQYQPPSDGSAYAAVFILPANPENPTLGDNFHRDIGLLQITLSYPINQGAGRAYAKGEEMRDTFKRGSTFTSGGITVCIASTPAIGPGMVQGDRYVLPVRVRWYANIFE